MQKPYPEKKLIRKYFPKNIVVITGITQTGKSLLESIISSFETSEVVQFNFLMEQFPMLHNFGYISDEVTVYLLRYALDFMQYDLFLGRNANFRPGDMSSIWKVKDPSVYFKRLFAKEGDAVYEEIKKLNPLHILNVHYGVINIEIFLKAFPDLKMIHLRRHPVDLVHIWYKKEYGEDYCENRRNGVLTIKGKRKLIPIFAVGWEDLFEKLKGMDRIVHLLNIVEKKQQEKISNLPVSVKKKLLVLYFEDVVTKPLPAVRKISKFLGVKKTLHTPIVLAKERCPRILKEEDRRASLKEIKRLASKESMKILNEMVREYENRK